MKKYLLDTNIASLLGSHKQGNSRLLKKFYNLNDDDMVMISIITLYEAQYGLYNSENREQQDEIKENIHYLKRFFEVIPLDTKEMDYFAHLKVSYKNQTGINKKSMKKNDLDILLASTAMAIDAILISDDAIFDKLSEIETHFYCENWLK